MPSNAKKYGVHRGQYCSILTWTAERCCQVRPTRVPLRVWPHAQGRSLLFPHPWSGFISHAWSVEPLTVAAYLTAIRAAERAAPPTSGGGGPKAASQARHWVVDVGANMGFFTLLGAALAPTHQLLSVEMQPLCTQIVRCALQLNGIAPSSNNLTVLNHYVSGTHRGGGGRANTSGILVPSRACDTMASPTAVGGRRPDGRLRGTMKNLNSSATIRVSPLALGSYLLARVRAPAERVSVVKVDVEGYEPLVVESLRPVWHLLDNVVIEVAPRSWQYHNLTFDEGVAPLRELVTSQGLRVLTLPKRRHGHGEKGRLASAELVDVCSRPAVSLNGTLRGQQAPSPHQQSSSPKSSRVATAAVSGLALLGAGIEGAVVFDQWAGMESLLRAVARSSRADWPEFLLTRRLCVRHPTNV